MNKKLLYGMIIPLLAVVLVSAGILTYYGQTTTNIEVTQPIRVNGVVEFSNANAPYTVPCDAGDVCYGEDLNISNIGDDERTVLISSEFTEESGDTGTSEISFVAEMTLTKKIVDFGSEEPWEIPGDAEEVTVMYTVIGDEFTAEVVAEDVDTEYTLVYYKDSSDRWATVGEAIPIDEIVGNLPYEDDGNFEDNGYCETNEYATCGGAKIWYVPNDALDDGEIVWSQENAEGIYFETYLIQFNSDNELIIYGGQTLTIIPRYSLDVALNEDPISVITTVNPVQI